jgi:signal transduction histidine kinase
LQKNHQFNSKIYRQVFTNLVSNAIKYSPDAEKVEIDLRTSEDAVTISVRDHGLGIPREQRDKIFDRFYRASGPKQRAIPGLGMGLYIVAEIVKGHGGTITVDSTEGRGSTFTVTFPRMHDAIAVDAHATRINCDDDGRRTLFRHGCCHHRPDWPISNVRDCGVT